MLLISPAWRAPLMCVCAVGAAAFAALAATLGVGGSTSFDAWMFREMYARVGSGGAATLLDISTPAISIALLALVAVVAALLRRWEVVALAAVGPGITVLLTREVFKPMLGREFVVDGFSALDGFSTTGSFPSGHESAVASASLVLAIVVGRLPLGRRARAAVFTVLVAWIVVAALGLVRNFYHYATDTIGAICLAAAVVPATALAIDAITRRSAARRSPSAAPSVDQQDRTVTTQRLGPVDHP
jgi:undecaprenyl-diphosphatase